MRHPKVLIIALLFSQSLMAFPMSPFEAQIVRSNICTDPSVQARLVAAYNSQPQLTAGHGTLVGIKNIRTTRADLVNESLSCRGDYTFSGGSTEDTEFGFPFDFRQP